jgi:hypothetical protein
VDPVDLEPEEDVKPKEARRQEESRTDSTEIDEEIRSAIGESPFPDQRVRSVMKRSPRTKIPDHELRHISLHSKYRENVLMGRHEVVSDIGFGEFLSEPISQLPFVSSYPRSIFSGRKSALFDQGLFGNDSGLSFSLQARSATCSV